MSIQSNFPAIKPTLLLDFANVKALDPRVTFSRASTGTFYGTQTAKAEENLLLQSQNYSTSWVVTSLTPVTGKTAPDATSNATEFTASAANAVLTQGYTAIAGSYTFSVFLRRVTGTGDIQIAADNGTWTTKVITGTWARYDVTQTVAAGSKTAGVRVVTDTDAIEVWGAQLEQRSAVTAYTATTTQPITNYIPVLQTAASGVARFDHNPTTFESLGLEIEEQRTNLMTYSEQFNDAAWVKTNATITANTIVAPDGALTGDKLVEDTSNAVHQARQSLIAVASTPYTLVVFAKAAERPILRLAGANFSSWATWPSAFFNLSTGTVTVNSGTNGTITPVGNGWYRCAISGVSAAGTPNLGLNLSTVVSGTNDSYTGNGYSGIFIWGAQLEVGAFPTSYIQTVASQVTRAADAASMTGANFSSWYNQAEGTFVASPTALKEGGFIYQASNNSATGDNRIFLRYLSNQSQGFVVTSAVTQAQIFDNTGFLASSNTTAFAYNVNDFAIRTNGGASASAAANDSSGTVPVVSRLDIGSFLGSSAFINGTIRKLAYYPLRCTNAQLQALTS